MRGSRILESWARAEEKAGNHELAAAIRQGATEVPDPSDPAPVALDDTYTVVEDDDWGTGTGLSTVFNGEDHNGTALTGALGGGQVWRLGDTGTNITFEICSTPLQCDTIHSEGRATNITGGPDRYGFRLAGLITGPGGADAVLCHLLEG